MKSRYVCVACAAAVLLGRSVSAEFIYELDHPVVIESTMSAITAPASTTSQPASIELMTMRLVEPTSCMSPCLSPIHDLVTPTDALLDQANDQRIDLMDMAWEEVSLSIRR